MKKYTCIGFSRDIQTKKINKYKLRSIIHPNLDLTEQEVINKIKSDELWIVNMCIVNKAGTPRVVYTTDINDLAYNDEAYRLVDEIADAVKVNVGADKCLDKIFEVEAMSFNVFENIDRMVDITYISYKNNKHDKIFKESLDNCFLIRDLELLLKTEAIKIKNEQINTNKIHLKDSDGAILMYILMETDSNYSWVLQFSIRALNGYINLVNTADEHFYFNKISFEDEQSLADNALKMIRKLLSKPETNEDALFLFDECMTNNAGFVEFDKMLNYLKGAYLLSNEQTEYIMHTLQKRIDDIRYNKDCLIEISNRALCTYVKYDSVWQRKARVKAYLENCILSQAVCGETYTEALEKSKNTKHTLDITIEQKMFDELWGMLDRMTSLVIPSEDDKS